MHGEQGAAEPHRQRRVARVCVATRALVEHPPPPVRCKPEIESWVTQSQLEKKGAHRDTIAKATMCPRTMPNFNAHPWTGHQGGGLHMRSKGGGHTPSIHDTRPKKPSQVPTHPSKERGKQGGGGTIILIITQLDGGSGKAANVGCRSHGV